MLDPSSLTSLPKGQVFALLEGGQLSKIRIPLPKKEDEDDLPQNLKELAAKLNRNYKTGDAWWTNHG